MLSSKHSTILDFLFGFVNCPSQNIIFSKVYLKFYVSNECFKSFGQEDSPQIVAQTLPDLACVVPQFDL